jgi:hypothetical protein
MICPLCHQEITSKASTTCAGNTHIRYADGVTLPSNPHDPGDSNRCGDCGVMPGGHHHAFCDMEYCPRCGRQRIGLCMCQEIGGQPVNNVVSFAPHSKS